MLFVFLSHFTEVFFLRNHLPVRIMYAITMLATPAFILISGMILGILHYSQAARFGQTRRRFIWRGIFLLTVGRVLIFLAHIPYAGGIESATHWAFVTDAIGVCLLLGPGIADHLTRWGRLALGFSLYAISWVVILYWSPEEKFLGAIKEFLFGPFLDKSRFFTDVFPLAPWLGLYVMATSLGDTVGQMLKEEKTASMISMTRIIGLLMVVLSIALFGLRLALENQLGNVSSELHLLLSPAQKMPPGPVYVLFYGGSALLLLYVLVRFQDHRAINTYSRLAEVVGRNSLFVFIVQYYVYFSILASIVLRPVSLWPLFFVVSAVLIWFCAYAWEQWKMRYIRVKAT